MTDQTKDTNNIHTDFLVASGEDQSFVVELDLDAIDELTEKGSFFVTAKTKHQAKLAVIEHVISSCFRMGEKRKGEMAIAELARRQQE